MIVSLFSSLSLIAGQSTKPNVISRCGLQVNTWNGSLFFRRTDLYIPARGPDLDFTWSYNSGETKYDYGYGPGWTHTFNVLYEKVGSSVCVKRWDGNRDTFRLVSGTYVPPVGCYDSLIQYVPGKFRLRSKYGLESFFDDSIHRKLTRIRDRYQNTITITYSGAYPVRISDAGGRILSLMWSAGRMTQLVDSISVPPRTYAYSYDANGNQRHAVDPLGNITGYEYDALKELTRIVDPHSSPFDVTYDSNGAVTRIQSPITNESFSYNRASRTTTYTLGGVTTTYAFDSIGRVIDIAGACCGNHRQFEYDSLGNITKVRDAKGNETRFTYDSHGNEITATDPYNHTVTSSYEPVFNHLTSKQDRRGNTWTCTYDEHGNCTNIAKPLSVNLSYSYNSYGEMTSYTDGNGHTTSFTCDPNGYITRADYPIGSDSITYNSAGFMLSYTDANGNTTRNTYNTLDQLVSMQNALGENLSYAYNGAGDVTDVQLPNGNVIHYAYDALGGITQISDNLGTLETNEYDAAGHRVSSTDGNGIKTTYTYNSEGSLLSATRAGSTDIFTYDAVGNLQSISDAEGITTSYELDKMNRIVSVSTGGIVTQTAYDANGNVTERDDGEGHSTMVTYDALDRPTQETFADGSQISYSWDQDDNIVSRTGSGGSYMTYLWDADGRLIRRDSHPPDYEQYDYDDGGRLVRAAGGCGISTFTYDGKGRVSSETMNGHTTGYAYNDVTGERSITYPSGLVVHESRDIRGRLTSITMGSHHIDFTRDPGDRLLSASYDGSLSSTYTHNNQGLVASLIHDAGSDLVAGFEYRYDRAGHQTIAVNRYDSTRSEAYGYNSLYWLISVLRGRPIAGLISSPVDTFLYIFDHAGNRHSTFHHGTTTYATNNVNEYTSLTPGGNIAYDFNGNLISRGSFFGSFDYRNYLAMGIDPGTFNPYSQYCYDALGRRIQKRTDKDTINYFYDGDRVIEERNNADAVTATYTYGGEYVDDLLSMVRDGKMYFYLKNTVGSVVAIADTSGNVVERYDYDPYGKPTIEELLPSWCPGNIVLNGSFNDSNAAGSMPTGHTAHWTLAYGSPDVLDTVGCGDTAYVGVWGNQYSGIGEAIQQTLATPIVPGHTYSISFCGIWHKESNRPYPPRYVFRASTVHLTGPQDPHAVVIGTSDPVIDTGWISLTLPDWVATGNYSILTVSITNQSSANNSDSVTYSYVDRVCMRDITSPTPRDSSIVGNRFLFTGREYDDETRLYSYRARHYDPELGRFIQRDPIGEWGDAQNLGNGYSYAGNDPINRFDPTGEMTGQPVPGAEIFVEQDPNDKPITSRSPNPNPHSPNAGTWADWLFPVSVSCAAQGGYPVDFIGASVGDPAIYGSWGRNSSSRGEVTNMRVTGLTDATGLMAAATCGVSSGPYSQSLSNMEDNGIISPSNPFGREGTSRVVAQVLRIGGIPFLFDANSMSVSVSSGPYSQSLSNMEDNGIIPARQAGSGNGNGSPRPMNLFRAFPFSSFGSYSTHFSSVNSYGIAEDDIK